ncbi:MAG: tyrosine recombinase [Chloroflexi bacterium]|jgi:integrase/recombinase XerD|nr:tyrosine recombinase [Chloroflexota bacterium]
MEQVLQTFLTFLKSEYRYSENTVAAYRNDLNQFFDFLMHGRAERLNSWAEVTPEIVDEYVYDLQHRKKPYAPSSIARKVAAVKSFFNYLHARSMVAHNPTEDIDSPKVEKRLPKTLAAKEIGELLQAPNRGDTPKHLRDAALLNMLYATGMRVSEVVFLQMDDVDLERKLLRVKVREGESLSREVPLDKEMHQILHKYLEDGRPYLLKNPTETALFLNHRGQQLTRQGLWLIIKSYAREAELTSEVTPHTLRHSFAAHKLDSGSDLEEVQRLLGHANISTTQIYTQLEEASEKV